jgi:hypothetical protein
MKVFTFLVLAWGVMGSVAASAVEGMPCSMRFLHATVRNVQPSPFAAKGCVFQIEVADPETETGCSLVVGEVDGQVFSDPQCQYSDGDQIGGYVFRTVSGAYETDFYKRHN